MENGDRSNGQDPSASKSRLVELAAVYLTLGATAFGGPAAHIGLMEQELVRRRQWLTRGHFLDLVGACNLLPGPSSSQVAMAIGFHRAGFAGLAGAGICFLLPSFIATLSVAWAYQRYGTLPQAVGLIYGTKPVMVAILLQALWNLRHAVMPPKTASMSRPFSTHPAWRWLVPALVCLGLLASIYGISPEFILLGAGSVGFLFALGPWNASSVASIIVLPVRHIRESLGGLFPGTIRIGQFALLSVVTGSMIGLSSIAIVFLKLGVIVFGSGYALLAFLQADLVDKRHWVTATQLLDAVTAGQITPGPVFTTATFLGFLLHGYSGAFVATGAIFMPSFFMVAGVGWLAPRLRRSSLASGFLNGVNAAAFAVMAAVLIQLGRLALTDALTWVLALSSALLLLRFRTNPTWLILAGAAIGLIAHGLHG